MSRIIDQTNREGAATVLYGTRNDVQQEVIDWLNTCLGISQFDHMTEKDAQQVIKSRCDKSIATLRKEVTSSVQENNSDIVAFVGHHADYEANHRSFDKMHTAMSSVADWQKGTRVIGLWVNESGQIDMLMQH